MTTTENEFKYMCRRVGGRVREQLSGEVTCRGDDGKVVLYDDEVVFRGEDGEELVADREDIRRKNRNIVADDAHGWSRDNYYEDAIVRFNPDEGVGVVSGIAAPGPQFLDRP